MSRQSWLTLSSTPTSFNCWRVLIPDDIAAEAVFRGALMLLEDPENWEQSIGGITVDECAALFSAGLETSLKMVSCGGMVMAVGTVFYHAGASAPAGSLVCDGGQYNTVDYPELFNAIGFAWGGSGSVFNVPDLADRVCVGVSSTISLADTGGEKTHSLTADENGEHYHELQATAAASKTGSGGNIVFSAVPIFQTTNSGSGTPHNNMQPYAGLLPCIIATSA